jgi:large subunit ribosomal protein L17
MRHQVKTVKLGRSQAHRKALLANQVCSLIEHHRIKTTLAKAKAVRPLAEKMITLGKKKTLHARRTALAVLRQADSVKKLFDELAPRAATRQGGYTRIIKLGQRKSDASEMAFIEWVDSPTIIEEVAAPVPAAKASKKAAAKPAAEAPAESAPAEGEAEPAKKPARKPRAKKTDDKPAE